MRPMSTTFRTVELKLANFDNSVRLNPDHIESIISTAGRRDDRAASRVRMVSGTEWVVAGTPEAVDDMVRKAAEVVEYATDVTILPPLPADLA